jgi:hypothetical protein
VLQRRRSNSKRPACASFLRSYAEGGLQALVGHTTFVRVLYALVEVVVGRQRLELKQSSAVLQVQPKELQNVVQFGVVKPQRSPLEQVRAAYSRAQNGSLEKTQNEVAA